MKKLIYLLSLLLLQIGTLVAQKNYMDIVDGFFSDYAKHSTKAYENLFESNKWVEKSNIQKVKIDYDDFLSDLGAYLGNELIVKKEVGQSYILLSYLVKHERQPYRIEFTLYKPKDNWLIQNFSYDTKFDEELESAARYDRLELKSK